MSRSNYQFIDTDTDTIVARLTRRFEQITGRTVQPAGYEKLLIQWAADIVVQERVNINYAANQNIPSRADGNNLDALGEMFYASERPQATYASTRMRFYLSEAQATAWLIPAGTRITSTDKLATFATTEDVYVPIGALYADVAAQCDTAGTIGNGYVEGQISDLVDVFPYYQSCTNLTESDGGSEQATDEEYYEQLRQSEDAYSDAGAAGGYIYFAKAVSTEIADVVANSPVAGYVYIFILMDDGTIATTEIKEAVLAKCNAATVRPLTDTVVVEDPNVVPYNINLTYYLSRQSARSAADISADVNTAVEEYKMWQSARIGRDINPSKLVSLLMATGIKRVVVTSPVFTALNDGSNNDTPDIAQVGTVSVTNGGYEDE